MQPELAALVVVPCNTHQELGFPSPSRAVGLLVVAVVVRLLSEA